MIWIKLLGAILIATADITIAVMFVWWLAKNP
jgi:hypothetical protein